MASLHLIPDSSFVLFLAPPAWGKTRMIEELWREGERGIVFISPLRALALEVHERFKKSKEVFYLEGQSEWREVQKNFHKASKPFLIATPECLQSEFYDYIESLEKRPLIVIDEFHLFYLWGESFRPILFESLMSLALSKAPILGLSATMEPKLIERWKFEFSLSMDHLFLINLGNQTLLKPPSYKHFYFSFFPEMFRRRFIYELLHQKKDTFLYFCSRRSEVDQWLDFCERRNIRALGCKGGEVQSFIEALKHCPEPQVIFSTSALSHGVNLPPLSKVFIGEALGRKDFWLQMAGRGGRKGETYELFSFDEFEENIRGKAKRFLKEFFFDFKVKWKLLISFE